LKRMQCSLCWKSRRVTWLTMMERGGSTSHLIIDFARQEDVDHTSFPPFAPSLRFPSLKVPGSRTPSQRQNTQTKITRLAPPYNQPEGLSQGQPGGRNPPRRPRNNRTRSLGLGNTPIRHWLGNMPTSVGSPLARPSPEAMCIVAAPPLAPQCPRVSKHSHQHHWDGGGVSQVQ